LSALAALTGLSGLAARLLAGLLIRLPLLALALLSGLLTGLALSLSRALAALTLLTLLLALLILVFVTHWLFPFFVVAPPRTELRSASFCSKDSTI
jgi:hypothetical protein